MENNDHIFRFCYLMYLLLSEIGKYKQENLLIYVFVNINFNHSLKPKVELKIDLKIICTHTFSYNVNSVMTLGVLCS